MNEFFDRWLLRLPPNAGRLLAVFCACLVLLNFWRLVEWGPEGLRVYLTQAIMQTTLFDFGWVLVIVSYFIHLDARRYGIRLMGPNCLGILRPDRGLNATFGHNNALQGNLALVSQSGAICTAILDWAEKNDIGFSTWCPRAWLPTWISVTTSTT